MVFRGDSQGDTVHRVNPMAHVQTGTGGMWAIPVPFRLYVYFYGYSGNISMP